MMSSNFRQFGPLFPIVILVIMLQYCRYKIFYTLPYGREFVFERLLVKMRYKCDEQLQGKQQDYKTRGHIFGHNSSFEGAEILFTKYCSILPLDIIHLLQLAI